MKNPVSRALYGYWSSLCHGRRAPDRHEIDPAQMRGMLPHTFMLEVDAVENGLRRYPIRISGTRLDAFFGRDLKGVAFADLWASASRIEMSALLALALDDAQPIVASLRTGHDDGAIACELLLLPLRHHGHTHARLLCSLAPHQTPPWIGLRQIDDLTLVSWRAIDGSAEATRDWDSLDGGVRRSHLVVYEGGRNQPATSHGVPQFPVKTGVSNSRDIRALTHSS